MLGQSLRCQLLPPYSIHILEISMMFLFWRSCKKEKIRKEKIRKKKRRKEEVNEKQKKEEREKGRKEKKEDMRERT